MRPLRPFGIPLLAIGTLAVVAASSRDSTSLRCTLVPGRTLVLLRVERDTTLRFAPTGARALSYTTRPDGAADSLLATPDTPMPAARVRLLQLDSATRAELVGAGITDGQPVAFIRAAPYGADCRTIRWTDPVPWVAAGDVGYARATLAAREHWVGGVPVLVIPEVWSYPYPRRRGLVLGAASTPLAPAEAVYSLNAALERPAPAARDTMRRGRALAWARSRRAVADLEPVRSIVRDAVLAVDRLALDRVTSRVRGTYRVTMASGGTEATWYFRTHDRPLGGWRDADSARTIADLLASPHTAGYLLAGSAAGALDALPTVAPRGAALRDGGQVWLAAEDRPTAPGNERRRVLRGRLELTLAAAPPALWDHLDPFETPRHPMDSAWYAQLGRTRSRAEQQHRLPLTLRLDAEGGVRADTTLVAGSRRLRVSIERVDTLSLRRPF